MSLASCTSNNNNSSESAAQSLDINGEWKVVSIGGDTVPETMQEAILAFDSNANTYHGVTGVNTINGSYQLSDCAFSLGEGAMTRMMGDSVSMDVEMKFVNAISAVKAVAAQEAALLLQDAEGNVLMTLVKK